MKQQICLLCRSGWTCEQKRRDSISEAGKSQNDETQTDDESYAFLLFSFPAYSLLPHCFFIPVSFHGVKSVDSLELRELEKKGDKLTEKPGQTVGTQEYL